MATEATLNICRNLWYHTGGMGKFDEDGCFYFLGQMMESIRVRGENVSAVEIGEIYLGHPKLNDWAAIGVPSELALEDVKLFVQLKTSVDGDLSEVREELFEFGRVRMSKFMTPWYIEFVAGFTWTQTGKIKKDVLLKMHRSVIG